MLNPTNESSTIEEHLLASSAMSSFVNSAVNFTDASLVLPEAPVQSFAQRRLNTLFESEATKIEKYTDEHWKTPEFPLARIKKIMRIDEDVKMISGEVPVILSKAIELFVTELTLRSWMLTEDSKRRTVQRSDIAMAIAKNDMFDFLIDIVPREEISTRNRSDAAGQSSSVSPELLQLYLQLLLQQSELGEGRKSSGLSDLKGADHSAAFQQTLATNAILQQQIQLIQQIAQLQQQISKNPVSIASDPNPTTNVIPLRHESSKSSVTISSSSNNHMSASVNQAANTLPQTTSDLLLPSSLASAFFPTRLSSSSRFSFSSIPSTDICDPNIPIDPNFTTGTEHAMALQSCGIDKTHLPLVSLQSDSSATFETDITIEADRE